MKSLVYDKKMMADFLDLIFEESSDTDVFYSALYYRNKYCKDSEIQNSSSLHLDRYLVKHPRRGGEFNANKIARRLSNTEGFTDLQTGNELNPIGLVAYVNVNPSDTFKAALKAISTYQKTIEDYTNILRKSGDAGPIATKIKKFDVDYMKAVQTTRSRKNFLDIDIDGDPLLVKAAFNRICTMVRMDGAIQIFTQGGMHSLLPIKSLEGINIHKILQDIEKKMKAEDPKAECKINSIGQVPIPGTFQGGKEVSFKQVI